jgi:hypothetical protein
MAAQATIKATGRSFSDVIAIGDVHGDLDVFRHVLIHANLIDDCDTWCGGKAHLIQCGDFVDRGPASTECFELLLGLRGPARRASGRVDVLMGNHELALVRGDYGMADVAEPWMLAAALKRAVVSGRVVAARAYRQYLITHAGVHDELLSLTIDDIITHTGRLPTVAGVARYLNLMLKQAVKADDFSHPMFNVGIARGGIHAFGGVFWSDYAEQCFGVSPQPHLWQVFGHTPPQMPTDPAFRVAEDARRLNLDVGMSAYYGGRPAYARLKTNEIQCICCDDGAVQNIPSAAAELALV